MERLKNNVLLLLPNLMHHFLQFLKLLHILLPYSHWHTASLTVPYIFLQIQRFSIQFLLPLNFFLFHCQSDLKFSSHK